MDKTIKEQKEFYDTFWEKINKRIFINIIENTRLNTVKRFIKSISNEKQNILDFGCGRGLMSKLASDYGEVIGIDLSVKDAREKYPEIKFYEGDCLTTNIKEKPFNIILSIEVIEHIEKDKREEYIKKMHYYLKEGGYAILTTENKDVFKRYTYKLKYRQPIENNLTINELKTLIEKYFEIIKLETYFFFEPEPEQDKSFIRKFHTLLYIIGIGKVIEYFCRDTDKGEHIALLLYKPFKEPYMVEVDIENGKIKRSWLRKNEKT